MRVSGEVGAWVSSVSALFPNSVEPCRAAWARATAPQARAPRPPRAHPALQLTTQPSRSSSRRCSHACARLRGGDRGDAPALELQVAGVRLDIRTRRAEVAGREVELTAKEFTLPETFLRHPGQVLSREQLLSHVWATTSTPACSVEGGDAERAPHERRALDQNEPPAGRGRAPLGREQQGVAVCGLGGEDRLHGRSVSVERTNAPTWAGRAERPSPSEPCRS